MSIHSLLRRLRSLWASSALRGLTPHAQKSPRRRYSFRPTLETLEDRTVPSVNPIVAENQLPGTPEATWDISGAGDPNAQGFATDISVNVGQTEQFKISSLSSHYRLDIYRMGYYQ